MRLDGSSAVSGRVRLDGKSVFIMSGYVNADGVMELVTKLRRDIGDLEWCHFLCTLAKDFAPPEVKVKLMVCMELLALAIAEQKQNDEPF